ncbi:MAG TPA: hypothetical protein VMF69_08845, partial [Gemmataceae bacterium]|nr:hypothetical protein [Gemmataceae bacterium]
MKFAFLVHPLSNETKDLMRLDASGVLRDNWGDNILQFCLDLHTAAEVRRRTMRNSIVPGVRVIDELAALTSSAGARA